MAMSIEHLISRASSLAAAGRAAEAVALLDDAGSDGRPEPDFTLACWYLSGQVVKRDLAASRHYFRRAADRGSDDAAAVYRAFVANGTGGAPDWQEALRLLLEASSSNRAADEQRRLISTMNLLPDGSPVDSVPEGEVLSEAPDVRLFPGLFSAAECDYLARTATPLLEPALVVDPRTGRQMLNPIRTSEGAAFPLALENPAIHALNRRLAATSGTHISQGEPLQVLCYRPGQEYRAHSDALPGADNQRVLTFLVYLNDGYEGGETAFLETGLNVKGRLGDGLLFRNADAAGRPDPLSRHAGLPVTRGMKMIASRWIRAQPIKF
jgi:prolyl 4-hydroxylase